MLLRLCLFLVAFQRGAAPLAQDTKPRSHRSAKHWLAITGKPLGATAGALMFATGQPKSPTTL